MRPRALSVRELEHRVSAANGRTLRTPTPSTPEGEKRPDRQEHELSNGVVVIVKAKKGSPESGKIEIPYYSEDEKAWTLNILAGNV